MARTKNIGNLEAELEQKAKEIVAGLAGFTGGTRYLCLLHRAKEGGHGTEHKRRGGNYITHNPEEYYNALVRLLTLQAISSKPYRLYASVNPRDLSKAEKALKMDMLAVDFQGGDSKRFFYERLGANWVSAVMSPGSKMRDSSCFLIDCDGEGDITAPALTWLAQHEVKIVKVYKTPNGWHIITEPFNPTEFKIANCEIKKDALMLLAV